ncbi:phage shock protein C, PspC [Chthoniobacter flavus Ellin428]|uniref:Phage shock protein C, PspC n=1 Tax=Chthoniobacter flavus Ellin428 TaxID=497964 RepID=B4D2J0_9BACT|nr:phage shock protein C, PspC [Chthoniobacter flavus Ellin428]
MSFWSNLRNLSKSKSDCVIGGVCGGLGAHTPIPAWMWAGPPFLVALLVFGTGGLVYIILWIALPEEKPQPPPRRKRESGWLRLERSDGSAVPWGQLIVDSPPRSRRSIRSAELCEDLLPAQAVLVFSSRSRGGFGNAIAGQFHCVEGGRILSSRSRTILPHPRNRVSPLNEHSQSLTLGTRE